MRKGIYILLAFIAVCFGGLGYFEGMGHGRESASAQFTELVDTSLEQVELGRYEMALTNVRSCILAMDSALIRFLDEPREKAFIQQFAYRASVCEKWWKLAFERSPNDDEDTYLSESKILYDGWQVSINETLETRIKMLAVESRLQLGGTEDDLHAYIKLDRKLSEQKAELKKFRDRIELYLVASWK